MTHQTQKRADDTARFFILRFWAVGVGFWVDLVKTGKILQKEQEKFGSYFALETIVKFGKIW